MKTALSLIRQVKEFGFRVEVTAEGVPTLKRELPGGFIPTPVMSSLKANRDDVVKALTPHFCEADGCGALVADAAALADANQCGPGAGCPFARCHYRG